MSVQSRTKVVVGSLLAGVVMLASTAVRVPAAGANTGVISGTAYEDANRNSAHDAGEAPWSGQQIYLFDGSGRNVGVAWTDSAGIYTFGGLADGQYRVAYASPSWGPLKMDWTPTTTGTWRPTSMVNLAGQATVDFGWRQIVRAADLDHPVATYRAADGLTVQIYNDAVAPEEVSQLVHQGGLIGQEASSIVVRVDGSQYTATGSSYAGSSPGPYSGFAAIATIDWMTWINLGENSLFHEYGHAWSGYFSVMVQQDPSLSGYLEVRGLAGDPRIDSSYGWSRKELIAEDYRQLFGPPAAQAGAQANGELPPASTVPGLAEYLAGAFRQAAPPPPPPPPPPPEPVPLAVTGLAMSPQPVAKSGVVGYSLSTAASVTVVVTTPSGALVRTLVAGASQGSGSQSLAWDRRDGKGRRVASGTYRARVTATAQGATTTVSADFTVA